MSASSLGPEPGAARTGKASADGSQAAPVSEVAFTSESTAISVCIVCRNEADKLGPALESVHWADEVLVLDLASTDGSVDLAAQYGARVLMGEPVPIVEMVRNEIAAEARNDWILVLDPDERVTPGLGDELTRIARENRADAVVIPRMNYDLGHPPSHPLQRFEPQLRMYRKSRVSWPEVPNALPSVAEARLHRIAPRDEFVLIHERSRTIPEVLERSLRYAPLQAQSMIDRGEVFSARAMFRALGRQVARHFFKAQALRDGVPGFLRGGILVGFHFYVWAAFWQLSGGTRTPEDDRYMGRIGKALEGVRLSGRSVAAPLRLFRRLRSRSRK